MTRLVLSPAAFRDIDRLTDFLLESDPVAAGDTTPLLISGLRVLQEHPLIGRPVEMGYRELVISRGNTGYVALYTYDMKNDIALILTSAINAKRGISDSASCAVPGSKFRVPSSTFIVPGSKL